ncbi:MAG: DUF5671 domain-containing protein [Chloroflexota bacterium]
MQTIRRIYFYAVALVSVETIVWGLIGLLRSVASPQIVGGAVERLAAPLAFVLVGLPVFYLHWRAVQRSASVSAEEATTWERAVFFYAVLAFTLVPIVQNTLAFLSRTLQLAFGSEAWQALVGGGQTITDNAVAVIINGLAAAYFFDQLKRNWQGYGNVGKDGIYSADWERFADIRRLYRYLWLVYAVVLAVFGAFQLIQYVLLTPQALGLGGRPNLANGLALIFIGFPLWVYVRGGINRSLEQRSEAQSWLRLIFLYGLALFGLFALLFNGGRILDVILRAVLGENMGREHFASLLRPAVGMALPFLAVWIEYGRALNLRIQLGRKIEERQSLKRIYHSILSLAGLVAWLGGVAQILNFLIDLTANPQVSWGDDLRKVLSGGLVLLIIGFPLWAANWSKLAREAAQPDAAGEHSRRSLVRRGSLYLLIFAGVVGVMFSSGAFLYRLLSAVLGSQAENLMLESLRNLRLLAIFAFVLIYHWRALRSDMRGTAGELAARHAAYAVGVVTDEEAFTQAFRTAVEREAPNLPVTFLTATELDSFSGLQELKCLVLPAQVYLNATPERLKRLQQYQGERLLAPDSTPGWNWLSGVGVSPTWQARRAAKWVRLLAEGETLPKPTESNPWTTVAYILAGLMLLQILFIVVMMGVSLVAD